MPKERSTRNKTITLTDEEVMAYSAQCIKQINTNCKLDFINCKLFHGDTFEVLPILPVGFVDLCIADPPYNLRKNYGESSFKRMKDTDYYDFTKRWVMDVKPLLKPYASVYVCCDWRSSLIIGQVLQEHFYIQNRITWQREKGRGAERNWKNSLEDIWFCTVSANDFTYNADAVKMRRRVLAPYKSDGEPKDWFETKNGSFRDTYASNFWDDMVVPFWSMPENTDHPTQKPEKLLAKLILASSNEGDMVFDPFSGAGTTAVTAKKLGRNFCGIEREREYCALAQKRLETAETDRHIQGFEDGVFWERNAKNK